MALTIRVKVTPSAHTYAWKLDNNGHLRCTLTSQPDKGKANKELIKKLAKQLNIPHTAIEIITGHTSRYKTLKLHAVLTYESFLASVGIQDIQIKLTK